jgi:hypothetical protein
LLISEHCEKWSQPKGYPSRFAESIVKRLVASSVTILQIKMLTLGQRGESLGLIKRVKVLEVFNARDVEPEAYDSISPARQITGGCMGRNLVLGLLIILQQ